MHRALALLALSSFSATAAPLDSQALSDVGVAHWNATFKTASTGERTELDGVFVLRFDEQNLVSELREWWVLRP